MASYHFIHAEETIGTRSVRRMCSALCVQRSGYYAWRDGLTSSHATADARLGGHIKAIHRRRRGTYGAPRVLAELIAEEQIVGHRRVARLMRQHGLASALNRAWFGDITYLRTRCDWAYLAVLIDLFSRKVVGWSVDDHMRTELVEKALDSGAATRAPSRGWVHHTDRGVQYASAAYQKRLAQLGAQVSMSRKGD